MLVFILFLPSVTKVFGVGQDDSAHLADQPVFLMICLAAYFDICFFLTCYANWHRWSTFGQYLQQMVVFLSVYFQWFRIFRFTSDTLPEGCAGGGGGSSSFDWHPWLLIQGLGLVKSWQILMLSSSSHFPTATVNQQKLQQQRKSLSCWTVINIIHLFMQNHNLRQRVIFIDIDSNMSSTKTIQTIFIWYICC